LAVKPRIAVTSRESGGATRDPACPERRRVCWAVESVCPITAARAEARYPGDVPLPGGEAGQTRPGVVVCSQIRTISTRRIRGAPVGFVTDPHLRRHVRHALAHHLGLDIPTLTDGTP